jgi:hypothetical protein
MLKTGDLRIALLLACFVLVGLAPACLHMPLLPGAFDIRRNGSEPALAAPGGILDQLYGLENLTRVADLGDGLTDQFWTTSGLDAPLGIAIRAKHSSYSYSFGILDGAAGLDDFVAVAAIPSRPGDFPANPATVAPANLGPVFRFALRIEKGNDEFWSSAIADNASSYANPAGDSGDHMYTWQITGNARHAGNNIGNFVCAWEDLPDYTRCYDGDYNDLVLEVAAAAIPEPLTILHLAVGAGCIVSCPRQRKTI